MDEKWAKSRKSSICLYKFDKLLLRTCAEVLKSHFPLSVLNIYLLNLTKTSFEVPKCPLCIRTPVAALYENVGHRFVLAPLLVCGDGQVYRWGWAGVSVDCVARRQHCDLYWEWGAGRGEPTETEMCSRKKRNESQRYQDRKKKCERVRQMERWMVMQGIEVLEVVLWSKSMGSAQKKVRRECAGKVE